MSVRVTERICTVPFPLYCLSVWLSVYAQSHSLCIICPCDRVHLNCPISSILPVWVTALVLSRFLYTVWVIECIYIVPFPLYHLSLWPIYESTTAHLSLKKLWFMDSMFFLSPSINAILKWLTPLPIFLLQNHPGSGGALGCVRLSLHLLPPTPTSKLHTVSLSRDMSALNKVNNTISGLGLACLYSGLSCSIKADTDIDLNMFHKQ